MAGEAGDVDVHAREKALCGVLILWETVWPNLEEPCGVRVRSCTEIKRTRALVDFSF